MHPLDEDSKGTLWFFALLALAFFMAVLFPTGGCVARSALVGTYSQVLSDQAQALSALETLSKVCQDAQTTEAGLQACRTPRNTILAALAAQQATLASLNGSPLDGGSK
jgi:hypothetical protein